MLFKKETSLVTAGDITDLYFKIKFKGARSVFSKLFSGSFENRVSAKWDAYASVSDFWIIPEIKKYWNTKISGNPEMIYEDYVWQKYLKDKKALNLLSIGCGEGGHERNFAKHQNFKNITGVDVSPESIRKAQRLASENNLPIDYFCDDFFRFHFDIKFDVILFNASLHHFSDIDGFLKNHITPLLTENGIVVVFEYCGPNRLQWRESQLHEANRLLKELPPKFKTRIDSMTIKKTVSRPGLLRMLMVDPSEAPDSANLAVALRNNFSVLEETKLGWNILHILLKDIAHNFLSDDAETKTLIRKLIKEEENFVKRINQNDAVFGVYKKAKSLII